MKTLLVLRHGKSSWSDPWDDDHDRKLKGRGKRAASAMGKELLERDMVPDLVISSTAKRARDTAKRACASCGYSGRILKEKGHYFTSVKRHLKVIRECAGDRDQCVMIVGHNPDLEDVVDDLTGEYVTLTTANLACIDFEIDTWDDLRSARGDLRWVIRPRDVGTRELNPRQRRSRGTRLRKIR